MVRLTPADTPRIVTALMRIRVSALLVLLAVLPALIVLTPLAYASPPDPAWISGYFDDADHDDVVVLVTSSGAAVEPFPIHRHGTVLVPAGSLAPVAAPAISSRPLSRSTPRAPPTV